MAETSLCLQQVGTPLPCGEGDADDHRVNGICAWIATLIISFPDIDKRVNVPSKMLNVANVLHKWNNFHSVAGFLVCIQAYSAISRLKKTHPLLPESSHKIHDKGDIFPL